MNGNDNQLGPNSCMLAPTPDKQQYPATLNLKEIEGNLEEKLPGQKNMKFIYV